MRYNSIWTPTRHKTFFNTHNYFLWKKLRFTVCQWHWYFLYRKKCWWVAKCSWQKMVWLQVSSKWPQNYFFLLSMERFEILIYIKMIQKVNKIEEHKRTVGTWLNFQPRFLKKCREKGAGLSRGSVAWSVTDSEVSLRLCSIFKKESGPQKVMPVSPQNFLWRICLLHLLLSQSLMVETE